MKKIASDKDNVILRFNKNEDVIKRLTEYCDRHNIHSANFTGLGACGSVTLSYYDLEAKQYLDKQFDEDLEIVSLIGNVAILNNITTIHAHGVFGNRKYQTIGGHVKELTISATCEIHLTILAGKMRRVYDPDTGLNLLQ